MVGRGIDIAAYNTTENAADFADLRQVLGIAQWNVFGVSYMHDDCRVWDVPPAPAAFRWPVQSQIPTLILSGTFDAVTTLPWTRAAARTLPNATIVQIPGVGHFVVPESRCAQEVVATFLARPNTPDTSCVASLRPPTFVTG